VSEWIVISKWNDVENGNPPGYGSYLVCYYGRDGREVEQATYHGSWTLYRTDSYDDAIVVEPTHWMHVPEPPK
jgi:hypothetical protein